jgi:hypothetical protein
MFRPVLIAAAVVAALTAVPAALAQAPANDNRANAQRLGSPPVSVGGTTAGATRENADPVGACAPVSNNSVWYRLDNTGDGRLIVHLDAADEIDLTVVVLRRVRSETSFVTCRNTDAKGNADFSFGTADEGNYLFMVAQRATSQPGGFRLTLLAPENSEAYPGTHLPARGVTTSVDPLVDSDDAWSTEMRPARTYRINLVTGGDKCVALALYGPRLRSFASGQPLRSASCGGYLTFTPGPSGGGRYSVRLFARGGERGEINYRLQVAEAGRDDTSPGVPLQNLEQRVGMLSGRSVDVIDLYRFQVGARSDVVLTLATGERMQTDLALLNDRGGNVRCACLASGGARMRLQLPRGRYFLALRAREHTGGRYRLRLLVREITKTGITIDGTRRAFATPGRSVVVAANVSPPRAGGLVRFKVDRFDPLQGWVFARFLTAEVGSDGVARVAWIPPSVGRWRIDARFRGTITRSPSRSGIATLLVGEPL